MQCNDAHGTVLDQGEFSIGSLWPEAYQLSFGSKMKEKREGQKLAVVLAFKALHGSLQQALWATPLSPGPQNPLLLLPEKAHNPSPLEMVIEFLGWA